ncbi:MAG: PrsW family intramembrane metalloprotease [Candidatus Limivicinus sp.]|jgi:RsiW-degrading membrane proteinase PrsW (M82 family)
MDLLVLAVLPSVILFAIIYHCDKKEKEPLGFLLKLFFFGALTIPFAIILGNLLESFFRELVDADSYLFFFLDNFIATALIEEGGKLFVLKKATWKHPAFDHSYDAVVFAVAVSLGFATVENIVFIIGEPVSTAIARAVFSIPGHVIYAVFMGCWYGRAKLAEKVSKTEKRKHLRRALFIPVLLHGFYDFCLSTEDDVFIYVFMVFELLITILAIIKVRKLSKEDRPINEPEAESIHECTP